MNETFEQIRSMLAKMGTDVLQGVIDFSPKLIGALVILLIGWILARIIRAVAIRLLRNSLDGLIERSGFNQVLERASPTATPSAILANVLYWLVLFMFIMGASEIVGLDAVKNAITQLLSYIPSLVSAAVVMAAGVFLARLTGTVVTSGASAANVSYASGLGAAARGGLIVMTGVVTMEQLGIDTQILVTVITVSVAAMVAGMGLAFALGSRDVVRSILAGHYLRQSLPEGREIEAAGVRGTVEQIGPVDTTLRTEERSVSIPNHRLLDEVIQR